MYPSNRAVSFDGDWEGFGNKEVKGNGGPVLSFKSGVLTVPQGNEGQEHRGSLMALSLLRSRGGAFGEKVSAAPLRNPHLPGKSTRTARGSTLPSPFASLLRPFLCVTGTS